MAELIGKGDDVLLYLDERRKFLIKVEDRVFHTHKGLVDLSKLVGKPYGTVIKSSLEVSFVALKPTICDYMYKLSRKTQVLYFKDVALIILRLGIGPGSRVVEGGTGSGALASALAFYVRPHGKVYSYDVRGDVLEVARRNLARAGVLDHVELRHADLSQGIEEEDVDAVVLDLASPWEVVPHAYRALKGSGGLASFSPTVNQVERTVKVLREEGFVDIEVVECLLRGLKVEEGATRPHSFMVAHTGYIVFARKMLK
ncbi:MAG: tRNA (adenine-N1)-methyltransferase [Candidatus Nezhaarchaeota archaeon]|nr:tRNA (adenine-N1)-methyltransferase [Candidatus Nezhaarchaeota archaeon]